ncbi:hypothetical protein SAMN05216464_110246 [Mucilaginibacter pineti]|uniref:Uncharacterized protein n=2 Tax=Mucilaginibacter pineti TaxID=1391627 RepID=A0A1G7GQE4_9SPHI|nr:hypothetical protein SAMN05216464_110246 [Mucilaginibacter pineti]
MVSILIMVIKIKLLHLYRNFKNTQMEHVIKTTGSESKRFSNPIIQMIEDKKRIIQAIKNGESLSTLKGIKIVSPL